MFFITLALLLEHVENQRLINILSQTCDLYMLLEWEKSTEYDAMLYFACVTQRCMIRRKFLILMILIGFTMFVVVIDTKLELCVWH